MLDSFAYFTSLKKGGSSLSFASYRPWKIKYLISRLQKGCFNCSSLVSVPIFLREPPFDSTDASASSYLFKFFARALLDKAHTRGGDTVYLVDPEGAATKIQIFVGL